MNLLFAEDDVRFGKLVSHMLQKKGRMPRRLVEQEDDAAAALSARINRPIRKEMVCFVFFAK